MLKFENYLALSALYNRVRQLRSRAWAAAPFPYLTPFVRGLTDTLPVYAIILVMNKKAKKRLKEAIQKEIAEKVKTPMPSQDLPATKNAPESRGFTVKPEKKRG